MKRLVNSILYVAISLSLFAQNNSLFENTVTQIVENNSSLTAKRASLFGATAELRTQNLLPDPEIEFEHQWGHQNIGNKWSVSIKQSFDWPGLYNSRAKAATTGKEVLSLLFLSEYYDARLTVTKALIDYINAKQLLQMREQVYANIDSLVKYTQQAFEHGETTILDLKKVRFEQADASLQLNRAQSTVDRLRHEIIALNGGKYIDLSAINSYRQDMLYSEDDYLSMAEKNNPSLAAAKFSLLKAKQDIMSARMSAFPGFTLGYIHDVELGDKFDGFNIGINLPLFSSRRRKAIAVSKALSAESEAEDYKCRVLANVSADFAEARKLRENLNVYNSLFTDDNNDYIMLLRKSWLGGQITTIELITEINYYTELRIEYLNLLRDYNTTLASLNRYEYQIAFDEAAQIK